MERPDYLQNAFSGRFDFYGIGQVEPLEVAQAANQDLVLDDCYLVVFRLRGAETGTCSVIFLDRPANGADESIALEIANILASRLATELSKNIGDLVELAPPQAYQKDEKAYGRMARFFEQALKNGTAGKAYEFVRDDQRTRLRCLYVADAYGQA